MRDENNLLAKLEQQGPMLKTILFHGTVESELLACDNFHVLTLAEHQIKTT